MSAHSKARYLVVFAVILLMAAPASGAADSPLIKASLLPLWIPQAQFAGYMVALEKGFYREKGIDLTLLAGGPSKPSFDSLASGEATFVIAWLSDGIKQRAAGVPAVHLSQIIQRSGLMVVAKKKSGITRPEDLMGRSVAIWEGDFQLPFAVFFEKHGVAAEILANYTSIGVFLKEAVDATAAMWYNEYHLMLDSGLNPDELTTFRMSDFGINFPEDGIYCTEKTLRSQPDLCKAVVDASLKGWLYAFDHPEEALDIVLRHADAAKSGTNRAHQRWMLDRMKDLILTDGQSTGLGRLDPQHYKDVGKLLLDAHLIHMLPPLHELTGGK